jgi:DNA-3-methyladenine glycosylase
MTEVQILSTTRNLPRAFYQRDTVTVAKDLLGKVLLHQIDETLLAGRIVETEAYLGQGDAAAHSAKGPTNRNRVVFGPPGHAYVYFIYGMYECLNLVAEPNGTAGCVLIRAIEPLTGLDDMRARRPKAKRDRDLASGPGKLTLALGVTRALNGADVTRGPLAVREFRNSDPLEIAASPRIGISASAHLPLRFYIADNEYVSRR